MHILLGTLRCIPNRELWYIHVIGHYIAFIQMNYGDMHNVSENWQYYIDGREYAQKIYIK